MTADMIDRAFQRLAACLAHDWHDIRASALPHAALDVEALHAELDRLETRLANRRVQIMDAEAARVEIPDAGHHHRA